MIRFTVIPAWEGAVGLAVTARGLAYVVLSASADHAEHAIRARFPGAQYDPDALANLGTQFGEYFDGRRTSFDVTLDLDGLSAFQRVALGACARIPYGQTSTYRELARRIGAPAAARAVGGAMARNPLPIVIPCHRVLATDGSLGGFSAEQGLALKRRLLEHEGASQFARHGEFRSARRLARA